MKKHYYLINNTIKKGDEMPLEEYYQEPNLIYTCQYQVDYNQWLNSLQPCDISEIELDKVIKHLYYCNKDKRDFEFKEMITSNNPIEVTDIIYVNYDSKNDIDVIEFKEQSKEVEIDDNFIYSINTKELISELDKWIEQCDIKINEFSEVGMENSMLSSMAMKTAYSNVKQLILEKSK